MEDVIAYGLTVGRFLPYAHIISQIMVVKSEEEDQVESLDRRSTAFSDYMPARPNDRRRGQRALQMAKQRWMPEQRQEIA